MKLLLLCTILAAVLASSASAQETTCKATLAHFKAIKTRMKYQKVVEIVGCEGSEISSSEMMGVETSMYMWSGAGSVMSNMNLMFQDGKLISKSQFGLE